MYGSLTHAIQMRTPQRCSVWLLGFVLLFPCSGICGVVKVRLYSDRFCSFFSGERTRSDAGLARYNVWSIKVESGAWYATVEQEVLGRRFPADARAAYTPQDGCVAFDQQIGSLMDAQWLSYDACDGSCNADCAAVLSSPESRSVRAFLQRQRDSGHLAKREACQEEIKTFNAAVKPTAPDAIVSCVCACLPLRYAIPDTEANRDWIKTQKNNCLDVSRVLELPTRPDYAARNSCWISTNADQ